MGNSSSKPAKKKGASAQPSFTRSDTSNSARSIRSVKSNRSSRSRRSNAESTRSGGSLSRQNTNQEENQDYFSLSHGTATESAQTPGFSGQDGVAHNSSGESFSGSHNRNNLAIDSSKANGSLQPNTPGSAVTPSSLPPSMLQLAPKMPILIRRDTGPSNSVGVDFNSLAAAGYGAMNANSPSGTDSELPRTPGGPSSAPGSVPISASNSAGNSAANSTVGSGSNTPTTTAFHRDISGNNSIPNASNDVSPTQGTQGTPGSIAIPSISISPSTPGISPAHTLSGPASPALTLTRTVSHAGSVTPSYSKSSPKVLDVEDLIQRLLDAGYSGKRTRSVCLKNSEIQLICQTAREIFLSQPMLLELSPPVKIVGDVHGQYSDLIRIFTKCGFPPAANYLFLGDYVDRGKQSLETILLLLCYKIKYPENFFLLRGNHECANVTRVYGFYDECKRRCNIKTWKTFIDTFNTLPVAAIVAAKIFCVHGGLSPSLNSLDDIRNIQRPTDVPDFGLLNDLLWSDPAETVNEWEDNERGVSYCFSKVAINKFLTKFQFDLVCRAHMVVEDGYEFFNDRSLVTVFSAPNYCGEFDNWGAVMSVSEELLCSFELLDPLDSVALKQVMRQGKNERRSAMMSSGHGGSY